jgi:hypothetical protein
MLKYSTKHERCTSGERGAVWGPMGSLDATQRERNLLSLPLIKARFLSHPAPSLVSMYTKLSCCSLLCSTAILLGLGLARGISPSQGRYLHTGQHTNIHASSGIRNHDLSVGAGEDSSCLRPRGHCGPAILTSGPVMTKGIFFTCGNTRTHIFEISPFYQSK